MAAALSPISCLLHATAKARSLGGQPLVVKLGGSAMEDPVTTRAMFEAVVALQTLGVRLVLLHGGGKPIDRAMDDAGLTPKKVLGRRYTDDATLEIVVRVLGEINHGIVVQIRELGGKAAGFSILPNDPTGYPLLGERLALRGPGGEVIDVGHVGQVIEVDLLQLEEADYRKEIPVLASLAKGHQGLTWLNVNADTAAAAVAGAMRADACYFLTDTPGVLRNRGEPTSLLPRLTASECRKLIADGVITGGMIPKVEACFEALAAGARRAVILDGRDPSALLAEFISERVAGTEVVP